MFYILAVTIHTLIQQKDEIENCVKPNFTSNTVRSHCYCPSPIFTRMKCGLQRDFYKMICRDCMKDRRFVQNVISGA